MVPNMESPQQAKQAIQRLLEVQKSNTLIEYRYLHSRLHVSGFADETGLVGRQDLEFFSGVTGEENKQGFKRKLTEADTFFTGGSAQMQTGEEFVGYSLGIAVAPEMPDWCKRELVYNSVLLHSRLNTNWRLGPVSHWGAAEHGLQARSAAIGGSGEFIPTVNGTQVSKRLPSAGVLVFPSKQTVEFTLKLFRPFYATDDGTPLKGSGSGTGTLIDNTGKTVVGGASGTIGTFQQEHSGYLSMLIGGYRLSVRGG